MVKPPSREREKKGNDAVCRMAIRSISASSITQSFAGKQTLFPPYFKNKTTLAAMNYTYTPTLLNVSGSRNKVNKVKNRGAYGGYEGCFVWKIRWK
jgi:hypothetical protein